MPMNDVLNEHERISILLTLNDSPGYRSNDSIIQDTCARYALTISRDRIKNHLAWLEEQGAVTTEKAGRTVVATLTERGQDVAEGRARMPGVKRPGAR